MHDVFPKARFRDCIAITEKVGHIAQLRVMRRQWIDESKPKKQMDEDDDLDLDGIEVLDSIEREQDAEEGGGSLGEQRDVDGTKEKNVEDEPLFVEDDMSDFDMDELLGTQKQTETTTEEKTSEDVGVVKSTEQDAFEDEIDAMRDIDDFF
jgi:replication fork protection complex subunit Csm3/Swi3